MKYFTFGMKTMRMTQSYNQGNHIPHWKGSTNYSDYPIDVAGEDTGRSPYYATVDMQVVSIKGHSQGYTDTIWLVATENCKTPIGNNVRPFIALTHWNQDDPYIVKLKENQIIKAGEIICLEGTDGQASGNHLHLVCGDANKGWANNVIKNSNGVWVCNGWCYRPEQIMYIDTEFTNIITTQDIIFEEKPEDDFFPERGYYMEGDSGENVLKIDDFYMSKVKGNYFGTYTKYLTMALQDKYKITGGIDGNIGANTLAKMKELGLSSSVKLPARGWFTEGDSGNDISLIDDFLATQVYGDYYGIFTKYGTMALQTIGKADGIYNDNIDGCFGAKTLATAEYYGFHY